MSQRLEPVSLLKFKGLPLADQWTPLLLTTAQCYQYAENEGQISIGNIEGKDDKNHIK